MKLSGPEVLHVARLARLRLDYDEVARLRKELSSILEYMEMLKEVDTRSMETTIHVQALTNALRGDAMTSSLGIRDALHNAPCVHDNTFEVPMVIDED